MTIAMAFWVLMLLALVFGLGWAWPWADRRVLGNSILLWLLLFLLGIGTFGWPIKG